MGSNIIELAKLGHERSAELKASCGAVDVRSLAQLISDLATQLEVQFVRSTNMAVQLANAESKCRELAGVVTENAALKKAAEFATADDMWIEQADGMLDYRYVDWYVDVLKAAMETPATDAFLDEVRAQGVEIFGDYLNGLGWDEKDIKQVREIAAQLRKGAKS
ncbi:hypothetical protein D9P45_05105 [Salmonella enterica subsp. enterica serovar Mesbit]|nr:hypothetical protein [Salmonella enterica subsp. enterica serovar Mesbit]